MTPLKKGDTIGVVAPSSPFERGPFVKGVKCLEGLGFRVRYSTRIFSRTSRQTYLAGDDRMRAEDLMKMFTDDTIKAVICARGGYGSQRIIPLLDTVRIRRSPKPFIGYSDVTALLLFLLQETHSPVFHGPLVATLGKGMSQASLEQFLRALTSPGLGRRACVGRMKALRRGRVRGRLTGGCLSLVAASLGTSWEIDTADAILFLEDRGEEPYRIDRMLTHLKQAGKFRSVRGILFGQMPGCGSPKVLENTITSVLNDVRGPIVSGFPSGHVKGEAFFTLPLGVPAELSGDVPSLTVLGSPFS